MTTLSPEQLNKIIATIKTRQWTAETCLNAKTTRNSPFYKGSAAAFRCAIGIIEKILREKND